VSAIVGAGIVPTTLELIDRVVLDVIGSYGGASFRKDAEALLLIEVDGEPSLVEAQGKRIKEFCKARGAAEVEMAPTRPRRTSSGMPEERPSVQSPACVPTASWKMRRCP